MPTTPKKFKLLFVLLPLVATVLSLPSVASAQAPPGKCVAPSQPNHGHGSAGSPQDLSKKLDDCNGELKAPSVGDAEMVEPAPDTGNSRVIRPGELPPHPNPPNNSND
ncbi:hypothetical protein MOV61_08020 [Neorhizobium sp. BETTINA12A]|uniref:hypothetical protein n=1 Tax=Neorhizobium sp. BETTINA12A TaxID=2908924 RepID=UPI001FF2FDD9|nr:hypothetical protein [Neorhizobium sp. BETTINA12A]MCJ9750664.1 hypothetical protein [Neorhizobium sp. BETTINA12A]